VTLLVTVTVPEVWLTSLTVQLTSPLAALVPVQLWAELPEPIVKVTVSPPTGVPGVGSLDVTTPLSVVG
jgi:hypothetical protein